LRAGASGDQLLRQLSIVVVNGPVQRRHAVGLSGVDVNALLEEEARPGAIGFLGRIRQRMPGRCRAARACGP